MYTQNIIHTLQTASLKRYKNRGIDTRFTKFTKVRDIEPQPVNFIAWSARLNKTAQLVVQFARQKVLNVMSAVIGYTHTTDKEHKSRL